MTVGTSSAATFVVERKHAPVVETHKCHLPGFVRRRVLGLRHGAIVRCTGCGSRYEWTYEPDYLGGSFSLWKPVGGHDGH